MDFQQTVSHNLQQKNLSHCRKKSFHCQKKYLRKYLRCYHNPRLYWLLHRLCWYLLFHRLLWHYRLHHTEYHRSLHLLCLYLHPHTQYHLQQRPRLYLRSHHRSHHTAHLLRCQLLHPAAPVLLLLHGPVLLPLPVLLQLLLLLPDVSLPLLPRYALPPDAEALLSALQEGSHSL